MTALLADVIKSGARHRSVQPIIIIARERGPCVDQFAPRMRCQQPTN
jgi:hypothetical protein